MKSTFGQKCVQTSVKALITLNSYNRHNFELSTDMDVKVCSCTKIRMKNKILALKTQNLKQQKTSVFAL